MKHCKILLLGVLLPGALSATIYEALSDDRDIDVRVERSVTVDVDVEEIVRSVEAELRAVEGELASAVDVGMTAAATVAECAFTRTEVASLDAADVSALRVTAGSGALTVTGRDGADRVVVRSTMCASNEGLLADLSTGLSNRAGTAVASTGYPRRAGRGRSYARIDMEIELPLGMPTDIEDSSGALVVRGTGETGISDGSGDMEVRATTGGLTIRDGSGGIVLREIGGDVDIVDGSGELMVSDVAGSVALTDGSGPIDIRGVDHGVEVRADGSGSIDVADIGGDFTVLADGSGSVRHSSVAGSVRVPGKR